MTDERDEIDARMHRMDQARAWCGDGVEALVAEVPVFNDAPLKEAIRAQALEEAAKLLERRAVKERAGPNLGGYPEIVAQAMETEAGRIRALSSTIVVGEVDWRMGLNVAFNDGVTLPALARGVSEGSFPLTSDGQVPWSDWLIDRIERYVSRAALAPQPPENGQ